MKITLTDEQTQTQAEQAAKALRSYARKLAWLAENDDGWVADWDNRNQIKCYVFHDSIDFATLAVFICQPTMLKNFVSYLIWEW